MTLCARVSLPCRPLRLLPDLHHGREADVRSRGSQSKRRNVTVSSRPCVVCLHPRRARGAAVQHAHHPPEICICRLTLCARVSLPCRPLRLLPDLHHGREADVRSRGSQSKRRHVTVSSRPCVECLHPRRARGAAVQHAHHPPEICICRMTLCARVSLPCRPLRLLPDLHHGREAEVRSRGSQSKRRDVTVSSRPCVVCLHPRRARGAAVQHAHHPPEICIRR